MSTSCTLFADGGGVQTYNAFLDKDLVTDIYFNVTPMVIGDGGVIYSNEV